MGVQLDINMNAALYLRNPSESELGKKIIMGSIELIDSNGFESFTFKKLAEHIGTTEAGIYRYFENKHRLLVYLVAWYWSWLEFQITYSTNNMTDARAKIEKAIMLLASNVEVDHRTSYINETLLHKIVISEGTKAYLTKHVNEDNRQKLFKPYKDLCNLLGNIILEYNPGYEYPKSLASTIIEMAHFQNFFMHNLPSLTDFGANKNEADVVAFLNNLVFSSINPK